MNVRIVTVTPKKAAAWLAKNEHNRALRKHNVERFVGIIERKEWKVTNDCLVLDTAGGVLNGQHRLAAIVRAGELFDWFEGVEMAVMTGAAVEAQDVMDSPLARRVADALQLRGEHQAGKLAAALAWTARLEMVAQTGTVFYSGGAVAPSKPSTPQLLGILDANPDIRNSIKRTQSPALALKLRYGLAAALHYAFNRLDVNEANVFYDKLGTGIELKGDDPIFLLRRALLTEATSVARMPDYREAALTIKAWNYWRDGRQIRSLQWRFGGTGQEAFPLPH